MDSRLIGHGERVSRIMYRLLKKDGTFSPLEIRNLLILAVLHDIGAYKMEEIDRMLEFETKHVWNHSIYGYLFFDYFTFLSEPAPIVLFHHSPWSVVGQMENIPQRIKWRHSFCTWRTGWISTIKIPDMREAIEAVGKTGTRRRKGVFQGDY